MALIKCPECGKEISDKASSCPNCGYPINNIETKSNENYEEQREDPNCPYTICPECGTYNPAGVFVCEKCRHRYAMGEYKVLTPWDPEKSSVLCSSSKRNNSNTKESEFNGIYKYTLFGKKQEIYCPRCKSEDCSHYTETNIIPAKTKTRYSANLNPLHLFTLVNKKEKIVKKEQTQETKMFVCNKCGKKFY